MGEKIIDFVTEEQAVKIAEKILKLLKEKDKDAADLLDEMGLEKFKEVIFPQKSEGHISMEQIFTP